MIDGTPTAGEVPTSTSYTEMRDESCLVEYGSRLRDFKILQEIDKASHHQDIAPLVARAETTTATQLCSYTNTSICCVAEKNLVYVTVRENRKKQPWRALLILAHLQGLLLVAAHIDAISFRLDQHLILGGPGSRVPQPDQSFPRGFAFVQRELKVMEYGDKRCENGYKP